MPASPKHRIEYRKSGYDQHPDHWYVEPPEAVEALLKAEQFSGDVWDPACGQGTIPKALLQAGHLSGSVYATDLVDRGYPFMLGTMDFLTSLYTTCPDNIVTNPPFKLLDDFVERAMAIVRHKAAFLVRLAALEGMTRYSRIFARYPLSRVHVFQNRISMPPGGQDIEPVGGVVAFCWWVFDKSHQGPPTIHWIKADFEMRRSWERLLA